MALLKKKEKKEKKGKKADTPDSKAAVKVAPPKLSKPHVPPDIYTLLLGLASLFLIVAMVVLGLNFYWYQTADPAVVPMSWAR